MSRFLAKKILVKKSTTGHTREQTTLPDIKAWISLFLIAAYRNMRCSNIFVAAYKIQLYDVDIVNISNKSEPHYIFDAGM